MKKEELKGGRREKNLSKPELINEYISEKKLREATGEEDLKKVQFLEIVVNTTTSTLANLGQKLPNLTHLKLNNSIIPNMRDLGTSLKNLKVLWVSRCNISCIEGIDAYSDTLKELYMSMNDVCDLSALVGMRKLEVLDMEGNSVKKLSQINFLSGLKKLESLNLMDNECSRKRNLYLMAVKKKLKNLKILDDHDINDGFNQIKKVIKNKRELDKYKRKKKLIEREKKFLYDSLKYTKVDKKNDLINNPMIIVKAPTWMPSTSKEEYINERSRPITAHVKLRKKSETFHSHSFFKRPTSARPKSDLFVYNVTSKKKFAKGLNEFNEMNFDNVPTRKSKRKRKLRKRKKKSKTEVDVTDDDKLLEMVLVNKFKSKSKNEIEGEENIKLDISQEVDEILSKKKKRKKKVKVKVEKKLNPLKLKSYKYKKSVSHGDLNRKSGISFVPDSLNPKTKRKKKKKKKVKKTVSKK